MKTLSLVLLSLLLIACSDNEQAAITDVRVIETGRVVYMRECSVCHGLEGAGDGIATPALSTSPRPVYEWIDEYDIGEFKAKLQTDHQPVFNSSNVNNIFFYIDAALRR